MIKLNSMPVKYNNKIDLALMAQKIDYIQKDVSEIKINIEKDYVTREEFEPIKRIVYGLITLLLAGVITAMLSIVLKK